MRNRIMFSAAIVSLALLLFGSSGAHAQVETFIPERTAVGAEVTPDGELKKLISMTTVKANATFAFTNLTTVSIADGVLRMTTAGMGVYTTPSRKFTLAFGGLVRRDFAVNEKAATTTRLVLLDQQTKGDDWYTSWKLAFCFREESFGLNGSLDDETIELGVGAQWEWLMGGIQTHNSRVGLFVQLNIGGHIFLKGTWLPGIVDFDGHWPFSFPGTDPTIMIIAGY